MVTLDNTETVDLYRLLKLNEEHLGSNLLPLLFRIERKLYETMSIEDVERLTKADVDSDSAKNRRRK